MEDKITQVINEILRDVGEEMKDEVLKMQEEHGEEYTELWLYENEKKFLAKYIFRACVRHVFGK